MKTVIKVFAVVLCIMFVSGCTFEEGYDGVEFEYNGHSYIEFRKYTGNQHWVIGTVHNPDCECHKEDK